MNTRHPSSLRPYALAMMVVISAGFAIGIAWHAVELSRVRNAAWQADIKEINGELDITIGEIRRLANTAKQAAGETLAIPNGERSPAAINGKLQKIIARHPEIAAAGIAFSPGGFDPARRLYAPFAVRHEGGPRTILLDNDLDYVRGSAWYAKAIFSGQAWFPPRHNDITQAVTVDFAVAQTLDGVSVVALVSLAAADIEAVLDRARLKGSSSAVVKSASGQIIARRDTQTSQMNDEHAAEAACRSNCYQTSGAIPGTPWSLVLTARKTDASLPEPTLRHITFFLTNLSICLLLAMAIFRLVMAPASMRELWLWSLVVSFALACGIGIIWWFELTNQPDHVASGERVMSRPAMEDFKRKTLIAAIEGRQPIPTIIPTGVFVQSMEFLSSNNVVVTGYVWQRLKPGDDVAEGISMPEADTVEIEEAYRHQGMSETTVGWSFRVTLRQSFGYSRFPLDWESVWIRLWPKALDRNILLVPDLDDYVTLADAALPGVERDIVIGGWTPRGAFFEYRQSGYSTNFGLPARATTTRPELYFNVIIQRTFLDAFVSHMTPIILVLILLFTMQLTVTREAANKDLIGFNSSTIITTCAALFFAVLLSHIEVRGALTAKQVFYVEYFYFLTYLVILLVCVNSILFTADNDIRGIHFRDNLLPKLLYWPAVTGVMYVITVAVFI